MTNRRITPEDCELMEVTFRNEPQDLDLAVGSLPWFDRQFARGIDFWICMLIGILPGAAWLYWFGGWLFLVPGIVVVAVFFLILVILVRRTKQSVSQVLPEQTLRLDPEWLEVQSATSWSRRRWDTISRVTAVPGAVVITLDHWLWYVIPARAFHNAEEIERFAALAAQYLRDRHSQSPLTPPPTIQVPPTLCQISYQSTKDDLLRPLLHPKAASQTQEKQPARKPSGWFKWGLWFYVLVCMIALMAISSSEPFPMGILALGSSIGLWLAGVVFLHRLRSHWAVRKINLRPEVLTLTISGCLFQSSGRISFLHWKDVVDVVHDEVLVIFKLLGGQFQVVPKRAFSSAEDAQQFYEWCQEYWSASHTDPAVPVAVPALLVDSGNPYQSPRET